MNRVKEVILRFWADNKAQLFEALKAAGRYLVFLFVGWGISYLGDLEQTQTTFVVFSFLTFLDKWLHENWRANDKTGIRGISPF